MRALWLTVQLREIVRAQVEPLHVKATIDRDHL